MAEDIADIAFASPEYDEAVRLRYDILRRPLGRVFEPEQLAEEFDQHHLGAFAPDGALVGCLSLVRQDVHTVKMRQVAVATAVQGKGIGSLMVLHAEAVARRMRMRRMILHARETAVPFYLKLGYTIIGSPFEEVGIPHARMEKAL